MKHLIITLFIAVAALSVKAQAPKQPQPEKPVLVLLPIESIKTVLNQAGEVIANSNTYWKDANPILLNLQQINTLLVPVKPDTVKVVPPKTAPVVKAGAKKDKPTN